MTSGRITGANSNIELDRRGLGEFYFDGAEKHGDRICQIDAATGQEESYKSVKLRSTRVAIHLKNLGLKSKNVVLCCTKNNLNSLIPVLSALYLDAKIASVDASQSVRDCAHCMSIVKPNYVFVQEESLELMENSLLEAKLTSTIIVVGKSEKYRTLSELLEPTLEEQNFRPVTIEDCHDTAFIYFSSGTTGLPKGIRVTHFGLLNNRKAILTMDVFDPRVILHFSSFYWISAASLTTTAFLTGGRRILASNFDAEEAFRIFERYQVTTTFMAPIYTHYLLNVKNKEKYDTSSLSRMMLGGTPIGADQLKKTRQLFKHTFVSCAYGSTEACGCITVFDYTKDRHLMDRYGSSGRCANDMEVKIVDVQTRGLLGPNQKGEICIKSPYMSPGYYNNPTSISDEGGFIKTGDLGYYDEDQCIYVVNRIKEMFKYKSWHVVPSFLEAILQEHLSVKEAAVFGIPHETDEFWPAAWIILEDDRRASEEDIDRFYTGKVSEWQKLRGGIKFVETLPKSPSGKLQRWKIEELFSNSKCNK